MDNETITRALQTVPGLVAMATTATETIYSGAFGVRELGKPAPMTLDTIFSLASMTKALTSVAAMQLVEQNRLQLDAPIATLLPALEAPMVLQGFDAADAPILRPATTPITLRQLLTHSAGYGYPMWNQSLLTFNERTGNATPPASWDDVRKIPLAFEPGTSWNYSIATDLVGKAVEAVSGQALSQYLRQHVLDPLGMHDTTDLISDEQRARGATVHAREPDGSLRPIDYPRGNGFGFFGGGGGLCGTAPDYLKFLRAMLAGGAPILRSDTVAEMAGNHLGPLRMLPMRTAMPARSNDVDFFPETKKTWGLGFMINETDIPGRRRAGSLAWAGIANTYFWIDPGIRHRRPACSCKSLPFADPGQHSTPWRAFEAVDLSPPDRGTP